MAIITSGADTIDSNLRGRRILVCLDRSAFSQICVPYAVSLAKTFESAITLVHVMQPFHEQAGPQTNDALSWEILRQEAHGYLERLEKDVARALRQPVELRLEQGRPAERIVALARELDVDLIVLGSHGEAGVASWRLGSTVQEILAVTRKSVLIAPSSSTVPSSVRPRRLLVPLDGSLRAESVLPTAVRMASAEGAEMLLVHAVQEPQPTALLQSAQDIEAQRDLAGRLEAGARRYLERLKDRLTREGANVRTLVARHQSPHQCLVEISQKEQSDLAVLSAHGSACDSARSFGSVAAYLLTHSSVPLLVLQDLPDADVRAPQGVEAQIAPPPMRAGYAPESP